MVFDLHKHYGVVAAVNRDQEVVLKPRRLAMDELEAWANVNLLPTDQVVLETIGNAWTVHDLLAPLVQRGGLTSRQFIRYHLLRLKLGQDLIRSTYGGMLRGLAPVEEILAHFPELAEQA